MKKNTKTFAQIISAEENIKQNKRVVKRQLGLAVVYLCGLVAVTVAVNTCLDSIEDKF